MLFTEDMRLLKALEVGYKLPGDIFEFEDSLYERHLWYPEIWEEWKLIDLYPEVNSLLWILFRGDWEDLGWIKWWSLIIKHCVTVVYNQITRKLLCSNHPYIEVLGNQKIACSKLIVAKIRMLR